MQLSHLIQYLKHRKLFLNAFLATFFYNIFNSHNPFAEFGFHCGLTPRGIYLTEIVRYQNETQ